MDINRTVSERLSSGSTDRAPAAGARRVQGSGDSAAPQVSRRPTSYRLAEDAGIRARVFRIAESPQNAASLARLDRILSSGQPLRGDVPRGYYLNIAV